MKKTFRRRAPRKGTLRKRTHGGRKLRKMRGGWKTKGDWEIDFTEEEKKELLDEYGELYKQGKTNGIKVYIEKFANGKYDQQMKDRFVYSINEVLSNGEAMHSGWR